METIRQWFNKFGDFGQRLQGIIWLAVSVIGFIAGFIVGLFGFQLSDVPAETRALVYFVALLLLAVAGLAVAAYVLYLRIKLTEQYQKLKDATEQSALVSIEEDFWRNLVRGNQGVDEVILEAVHNVYENLKTRREDCILLIMLTCQQNILPALDQNERRVAFLEYPTTGDYFTLVEGCGIAHESRYDVKRHLTKTEGVAAQAINSGSAVYVPNVDNVREAREKGYIPVSRIVRFRSIVCVGVWLNDQPLGVISADCKEPNAFTESDIVVLELFIQKVRLVYTIFPRW